MKCFLATLLFGLFAFLAGGIVISGGPLRANSSPQSGRAPVIVELFTSEGCSSCPPADVLLKKLEEQQPVSSAEIIPLEEHVDYWNSLGWADPFSSAQFTDRQERYAVALRTGGPYTPQMVVDGHAELVGSRGRQAAQEIEAATHNVKAAIEITRKVPSTDHTDHFSVRVGKLAGASSGDAAEVWLAITESHLHSAVTAGENNGETLQHASLVRRLQKIGDASVAAESSFSGDAAAKVDPSWKRENVRIAVFVQEKKSRRILAAASTSIP